MKFKHLAFLLLLTVSSIASAQGTVAHVNMEEVINLMPQTSQAEAELNRLRQAYQRDFETSYREYQAKFVKYEDEESTLSPAENEKRKSDLELIERNLAQTQQNIEKQIAEKRKLLFEPVKQQARELVTKVADNLGFLYVLDSSKDAGLVMAKGKDLMKFSVKPIKRICGLIKKKYPKTPIIVFPRNVGSKYTKYIFQDLDCISIGNDATDKTIKKIQEEKIIQGNLHPEILFKGGKKLEKETIKILKRFANKPFIFNLSHGIMPKTPIGNVKQLIKLIRKYRKQNEV